MQAAPLRPSERRPVAARPGASRLDGYGWAALALGVAYLALTTAGALATGTSWDESEHRRYGELALDFYTSLGAERAATTDVMRFYGALHALAGAAAERLLPFLHWSAARHLAAVAFGLVGFVFCVRSARLLAGPRAGFVAALLLATTPRWTGDAMYNPIDIPTAGAYAAALFFLVRIAGAPGTAAWRDWILFGATTGATLAVRTVGVLLPAQAALAFAAWALCLPRPRLATLRAQAARILAGFALAMAVAAAVACALWPRLLVEPFAALGASLAGTQSFPWDGTVLFRGQNVSALELPRSYLPIWFALTTPVATMLGLAFGLGLALAAALRGRLEREAVRRTGLVAFAVLFPLAYAVAARATLYDGIRHFLFVLPPLTALAAAGWAAALEVARGRGRALRLALPLALAACVVEPVVWYARSHPHAYVYFNPLAGGLAKASHRYESEYWGLSLRSAAEWLGERRSASTGSERAFVVGTNAPWHLLEPWLDAPASYRRVGINKPSDMILVYHRFRPRLETGSAAPLHTEILVEDQVPFWEAYPGVLLGHSRLDELDSESAR